MSAAITYQQRTHIDEDVRLFQTKLFLMKNTFYLAKSTSQSNEDLKGDLAREEGSTQFGNRNSAIKNGSVGAREICKAISPNLQAVSVSQRTGLFSLCGSSSCITIWRQHGKVPCDTEPEVVMLFCT